jgi:hypothetical protein
MDTVIFLVLPMQEVDYEMLLPHWWMDWHQVQPYGVEVQFRGIECGHAHSLPVVSTEPTEPFSSKPESVKPEVTEELKVYVIVVNEEQGCQKYVSILIGIKWLVIFNPKVNCSSEPWHYRLNSIKLLINQLC